MKNIIRTITLAVISLFLAALLNQNAYSQNSFMTSDNFDALSRAAIASFNEENLTLNFETFYGKACANILIKAHRRMSPYPDLPVANIPAADKEKYERLFSQLQNLRNNPPTWETIVSDEEKNLLQEYSRKNRSFSRVSSGGEVRTNESSSEESDAKNQAEPVEEKK